MKEIWKDVQGYEGIYQISNLGRVMSLGRYRAAKNKSIAFKKASIMKHEISRGYPRICLSKMGKIKKYLVHRLIAESFLTNPENKPQINHINGIKSDNKYNNLEWCTPSENVLHAYENGLNSRPEGSKHPLAKLNEKDVMDILGMRREGMIYKDIAEKYNVGLTTIRAVCSGQNWGHLTGIREDIKNI